MKLFLILFLAASACAQVVVKGSVSAPGNVKVVSGSGGGGVTPPPPPPSTDTEPILPQLWVNPIEYAQTCATYDVTLQLGFGTADYPATLAGLNSAIAQWGADTDKCYHIQILHGTLIQTTTSSVIFPVKNASYVKYLVVDSDTPLPPGQTVCSHGITDSTGPDPGVRNQGCNSPYNDIASMWTIEKANSGSTPAINIPPSAHHIAILNGEVRANISVTGVITMLVKLGANDATQTSLAQQPHHIALDRLYLHGYDPADGAGPTGTHTVRLINNNAIYFSLTNSYTDRQHHDGNDNQSFVSMNSAGPGLIVHNWFEGGTEVVLWGGAGAFISQNMARDWEVRRNRIGKNIQWKDLTGITTAGNSVCNPFPCQQAWGVKNNLEIKAGSRFVIDGNIIENTWDKGQQALFVLNAWGYGAAVQTGSTETWDILLSNTILRHAGEMATTQTRAAGGSVGDPGTFTTGQRRIKFSNLVTYDINKKSVYGDLNKARFAGGGGGGNSANATASRVSGVTTYTVTGWTPQSPGFTGCLNCPPLTSIGISEGDFVSTLYCSDTSFNTYDPNAHGPNAIAGTDDTHVKINQALSDATATGCVIYNGQGWGNGFTVDHITAAWGEQMKIWFSTTAGGFNRNISYTNSIFSATYTGTPSGWYCIGKVSGQAATDGCLDVATLKINHNIFQALPAASYKEYPSLAQPPTTIKFPANLVCSGATADATCVGYVGFMNGATYPPADWYAFDYHDLDLVPTSIGTAAAVDGTNLGADFSKLDAAMALNTYVCATACGSGPGPFPLTDAAPSSLIPPTRVIDWAASGIPGGIPARATLCTTLGTSGQASTFAQSTTAANINTALSSCASGQTVKLNAGTYTINGQINIPSNVTLRGAGTQSTILSATGTSSSAVVNMGSFGSTPTASLSTNITAGATQYSTVISVASATNISTGKFLLITELNDPAYVTVTTPNGTCTWCDNSMWSSTRVRGQIVEVMGVIGTSITIRPGLYSAYGAATGTSPAMATPFTAAATYAGVEDLQVKASNSGYTTNFAMTMCSYCWVARVEGNYADGDHVEMSFTFRNEVRDSYFTSGYSHTSGSTDDCIFMGGKASAGRIENNILERLHSSVILNWGAAGNVIGYNYSIGSFDSGATSAVMIDFDVHGAHPQFNLWEGNVTPHIFPDSFWGSGAFNTAYRNHVRGTTTVAPFTDTTYTGRKTIDWAGSHLATQQTRGISIAFPHTSYNLLGNVSGSADAFTAAGGAGFTSGTSPYTSTRVAPGTRNYSGTFYAFDVGYDTGSDTSGSGVPTTPINFVGLANSTLFAHGNWDMSSTSTIWDAGTSNHTLPASLYLGSKPAWFKTITYPPIGPDVTSGTVDTSRLAGHVFPIPAKACYDATSKDAAGLLLFDPTACY